MRFLKTWIYTSLVVLGVMAGAFGIITGMSWLGIHYPAACFVVAFLAITGIAAIFIDDGRGCF